MKNKKVENAAALAIEPILTGGGRTQSDIFNVICVSRDSWKLFLGTRTAVCNPYSLVLLYTYLFFIYRRCISKPLPSSRYTENLRPQCTQSCSLQTPLRPVPFTLVDE